jgi:hypothetical protein
MQPGNCVLRGCSVPPAILPRSPKLCENGGRSAVIFIGETEKIKVVVDDSHVVFGKEHTLVVKEV